MANDTTRSRAHIAERIRVRLAELDLSRADLCRAIGMPQATLSGKMHSRRPWTTEELEAVHGFLDIPYADFFPDDDLTAA